MNQYHSFKQQVVETAREFTEQGFLMATGGNLSVRIAGQSAFAITPSNFDYLKMNRTILYPRSRSARPRR